MTTSMGYVSPASPSSLKFAFVPSKLSCGPIRKATNLLKRCAKVLASGNDVDVKVAEDSNVETTRAGDELAPGTPEIEKGINKAVQKTAATFAPRASTASKNPAVPGSALYKVFEVQGYASMLVGGALSFNLVFPSNEPDLWRLMGMWSIWMFTIPSLRARDCSKEEKEALNYLFLLIPLVNVILPFFWKSFPLVWSADTLTFCAMYAWKMKWLERIRE